MNCWSVFAVDVWLVEGTMSGSARYAHGNDEYEQAPNDLLVKKYSSKTSACSKKDRRW